MNSYIKKYEFISPVTYEFIHPAQCMNSYVSNPCLEMATDGGGGVVDGVTATIAARIGPGFKSPLPGYIVLANLANFLMNRLNRQTDKLYWQ
jgi:hypothetical protein